MWVGVLIALNLGMRYAFGFIMVFFSIKHLFRMREMCINRYSSKKFGRVQWQKYIK